MKNREKEDRSIRAAKQEYYRTPMLVTVYSDGYMRGCRYVIRIVCKWLRKNLSSKDSNVVEQIISDLRKHINKSLE